MGVGWRRHQYLQQLARSAAKVTKPCRRRRRRLPPPRRHLLPPRHPLHQRRVAILSPDHPLKT